MKKQTIYTMLTALIAMIAFALCDTMVNAEESVVQVEINKGSMIKLQRPITSIIIADPNTADVQVVSPKLLFVHGKKVGETSIYAIDDLDETVFSGIIQVTHNISTLERTIKRIAPDADVDFRTVDGGMVMDGFATSVAESENIRNIASAFIGENEKMVNMLSTAGSDQVTLQVRVVEMTRTDLKQFGVNLQTLITQGAVSFQLLQGNDIELDSGGILDRAGSATGLYSTWNNGAGTTVTNVIDALETQGLATVLAEPTLTTTSGKEASFLAGGEFPIPVRDGNGSITVEYKPFGVSLRFTPVVMSKDRMSITVAPEVSTINFDNPIEVDGISNPIIETRKAEATVELGSGQTFALAGLLKGEGSNSIDKFPGLGDVPVLGTLFRSQQFQNNQTELVILVTPYVVRPVSDHKLQTPMDGYVPPNDLQYLLLGNLYQQESMDKEEMESAPKLHSDGGFILE